jgi:hypothetical protein
MKCQACLPESGKNVSLLAKLAVRATPFQFGLPFDGFTVER